MSPVTQPAPKPVRPPIKKPPRKPPPPPPSILEQIIPWLYIVGGVIAILWLLSIATPEKELNCVNTGGRNSLLHFGTCTTDEEP